MIGAMQEPRIAIVCDWLTSWGGAERVIFALHQLFPTAPIYTSVYDASNFPLLAQADVRPSFLQHYPGAKRHHPWYLSQMPKAFESFDLRDYDIVISSSHSCAKGIVTKPETFHLSYCHSPPRYLWDDSHRYLQDYPWPNWLKRLVIPQALHRLRIWDRAAADRVDRYVANSHYISSRIEKYYRRDSEVIHPPVDMGAFQEVQKEDYFLAVGRIIPYKRFDLIVETFNQLKWPLKIVGVGNQYKALKQKAAKNIEFLGMISEEDLRERYAHAQGLIFPQVEDFGITAVEAMAYGCPVIAYRAGGALETVKEGVSGLFFDDQTVESLKEGLERFKSTRFDMRAVRAHAETFETKVFDERFTAFLMRSWAEWKKGLEST